MVPKLKEICYHKWYLGEELRMCSRFCHPTFWNDKDFIGVLNCAQPMRYRDGSAALLGLVQRLLHHLENQDI